MIKEIILSLSMLLTVQYCTYNEDNGVFDQHIDGEKDGVVVADAVAGEAACP